MLKTTLLFIFIALSPLLSIAHLKIDKDSVVPTKHSFGFGLRVQKAVGFYWSNGVSVEYASEKILKKSLAFGLFFISSRLGSAAFSNAIPCYELNGTVIKYFRMSKPLKTLFKLNAGYAHANYGSDIYNTITSQSMTLALEAGLAYDLKFPLRFVVGLGFNCIQGDGLNGLGTLYPLYGQFSIVYRMSTK